MLTMIGLPDDMLRLIYSHLGFFDIVRLSMTCTFNSQITQKMYPNTKALMNQYHNKISIKECEEKHNTNHQDIQFEQIFAYQNSLQSLKDIEYWSYVALKVSNSVPLRGLYNSIVKEICKYDFLNRQIHRKSNTITYEQRNVIQIKPKPNRIIMVQAYAGCGKTTTLFEYATKYNQSKILYLAYNHSLAEESKTKFGKLQKHVDIHTIHSLAFTKLQIADFYKIGKLNYHVLKHFFPYNTQEEIQTIIKSFERYCNSDVTKPWDENINMIWNEMFVNKTISITHDAYLKMFQLNPIKLNNYDVIMLDEVQDCTDCMLDIVLCNDSTTRIFVGDRFQKIYGFKNIGNPFKYIYNNKQNAKLFFKNLSISFRMGFDLMFYTNSFLRHTYNVSNGFSKSLCSFNTEIKTHDFQLNRFEKGSVILCRYNTNVFKTMFRLCLEGYTFNTFGKNFKFDKEITIIDDLIKIENNDNENITHSKLKNFHSLEELLEHYKFNQKWKDRVQLFRFYSGPFLKNLWLSSKNHLNTDNPDFIVTTAHQSKGSEFNHVILFNDFNFTNDYETYNVMYVAMTRAKKTLYINQLLLDYLKKIKKNVYYKTNQIVNMGKCKLCTNCFTNSSICVENDAISVIGNPCEVFHYENCCTRCSNAIFKV